MQLVYFQLAQRVRKKKSELGDGRLFEREDIFERKKDHLRVRGEGRARAKKKPKGMKGAFSGMTLQTPYFSSSSYTFISILLFLVVTSLIWMWVASHLCLRLRSELSMSFDIANSCFVHIIMFVDWSQNMCSNDTYSI